LNHAWPWLALVGLGLFHGVNPAMGWLFAVALGLHRGSGRIVLVSLVPLALGHALAISMTIAVVLTLGILIDLSFIAVISGLALIAWALWHVLYGHRHRVRVGMQTGLWGLGVWSFLMASAHGAGLMLVPALLPLYSGHGHMHGLAANSLLRSALAVIVHSLAMISATGLIAAVVYRWVGLSILKRAWINFDLLWTAMLVLAGLLLIVQATAGSVDLAVP
jgi:hypothetical protein